MDFELLLTLILCAVLLISAIGYKIVSLRNKEDPEYATKVAEREREAKRKSELNSSLDNYMNSNY